MRPIFLLLSCSACLVSDPYVADYLDADGDGDLTHEAGGSDCDDSNPAISPRATEVCGDGLDNDCDGLTDDDDGITTWFVDVDGDGFGVVDQPTTACTAPPGTSAIPGDCDDAAATTHPGATDLCGDQIDNDCNGATDDGDDPPTWWPDRDGDGFGDTFSPPVRSCARPVAHVVISGDCDDNNASAFPGGTEHPYDGVDGDCDQGNDFDLDGDGFGADPQLAGFTPPPGYPLPDAQLDCDDLDPTRAPGSAETPYDGIDQDCDGADLVDVDSDGYAGGPQGPDCDDNDPDVYPGRTEVPYDAVDDNCDPTDDFDADADGQPLADDCDDEDPDNWLSCDTCLDRDDDGSYIGCDAYVLRPWDCDDTDPTRHAGTPEVWGDGIDQDCSGDDLVAATSAGLFVSPFGADTPECGAPDTPCRQVQYAVDLATDEGRPVFIAAGEYDTVDTTVSLYGGFDPVTWARDIDVWTSTIYGRDSLGSTRFGLVVSSESTVIDGLTVATSGIVESLEVIHVEAPTVHLQDLLVSAQTGTRECVGIVLATPEATLERVRIEGCAGSVRSIGLLASGSRATTSRRLTASGLSIEVPGGWSTTGSNVGIELGMNDATLINFDVVVSGAGTCNGIRIVAPEDSSFETSALLQDGTVRVFNRGTQGRAAGVWGEFRGHLRIVNLASLATGGATAHGIRIAPEGESVLEVGGSHLAAHSATDHFGIELMDPTGTSSFSLVHDTIVTDAPGTLLAGNAASGELASTLLLGGDLALALTPTTLRSNHFDTPCIATSTSGCLDVAALELCQELRCEDASGNQTGNSLVVASGPMELQIPDPASPLLNRGLPIAPWLSPIDLLGTPWNTATPDVGAVQSGIQAP